MLRKALVSTILGIAILIQGQTASAQSQQSPPQTGLQKLSNSVNQIGKGVNRFGKDVNQFGKNLIGFVLDDKGKNEKSNQKTRQGETVDPDFSTSRAGSVLNRYRTSRADGQNATFPQRPTPVKESYHNTKTLSEPWPYNTSESNQTATNTDSDDAGPALSQPSNVQILSSEPKASDTSSTTGSSKTYSSSNTYSSPKYTPYTPSSNDSPSTTTTTTRTTTKDTPSSTPQVPLYQRLRSLKQSPFESSNTNAATTTQQYTQQPSQPIEAQPVEAQQIESGQTSRESDSSAIRMDSYGTHSKPNLEKSQKSSPSYNNSPSYRDNSPSYRNSPSYQNKNTPLRSTSSSQDQILLRRNSPVLNVQTMGPAKINIGREAKYKVIVENQGDVTANEVLVTVELPEWADVVGTEAEQGTAAIDRSASSRRLCWRLASLPGNARHEMTLRLIPRARRPIELAVRSSFTQVASQAVIEVQEPNLSMRLIGPKQIQLGEVEYFKIEISNTGNGPAEDMVLTMLPLTDKSMPTTHRLGSLEAGQKRMIKLELTAQQVENISVEADLKCNASKGTQLIEKLTVLAPNVKTGIFGPAVRFLNTKGRYQIKVANFGNFEAKNVEVRTVIPQEAKFLKGNKNALFEKTSNTVAWKIASLKPRQEEVFDIECEMVRQGTARLLVNVNDGRYTDLSKVAAIRVEAMADLTLEVVDPKGPISVGEEAVYEIHIRNQGTRPAEMVSAVAYFSNGIEPVGASGVKHRITAGRVSFETIGSIAPKDVVVLKVRAVAEQPGNHMFRAETECASLGTKLIGEDTTYFYRGARLANDDLQPGPNNGGKLETADRRNEPTLAPRRDAPSR